MPSLRAISASCPSKVAIGHLYFFCVFMQHSRSCNFYRQRIQWLHNTHAKYGREDRPFGLALLPVVDFAEG
jgi:hypothetical protein